MERLDSARSRPGDFRADPLRTGRAGTDWYDHRREVGRLGEELAVAFLRRRGCAILERNVDVGRGELDVVASGRRGPFVVEVKTGVGDHAQPEDAFDSDKAIQVRELAGRLRLHIDRVDLITVVLGSEGVRIWWTPFAG